VFGSVGADPGDAQENEPTSFLSNQFSGDSNLDLLNLSNPELSWHSDPSPDLLVLGQPPDEDQLEDELHASPAHTGGGGQRNKYM